MAPSILSPESDVVVADKLRLGELDVERARALADMESMDADLSGDDQALGRLHDLQREAGDAILWTSAVTSQQAQEKAGELKSLADQGRVLAEMVGEQQRLLTGAQKELEAGLLSRADYARQQQALSQTQLALLENDRATLQSQSAMREASLAQQALSQKMGVPRMPELMARQEQAIRVELEIVRLDSERHAKLAQRKALSERVAKLDAMAAQIRSRPMFQAIDKNLAIAFVPYTQIDGVTPGADVYGCLWGLFFCKQVGTVAELAPGEVVLPDPWGTPARGQYALLDLRDRDSARSKTLRVRSWTRSAGLQEPEPRLSVR